MAKRPPLVLVLQAGGPNCVPVGTQTWELEAKAQHGLGSKETGTPVTSPMGLGDSTQAAHAQASWAVQTPSWSPSGVTEKRA